MVTWVLGASDFTGDSGGDIGSRVGVASGVVMPARGGGVLVALPPVPGVGVEFSPLTAVGVVPGAGESQLARTPAKASRTTARSSRGCLFSVCSFFMRT